ncbi:protein SRC2-like [Helianthus annuus]|uniref:protein SRC2-like n=1 Tax=Helianthus annuus TaxID=4232 RepID=UPI0016531CEE|nr:protein SRC2-like [Helianthus annuus]
MDDYRTLNLTLISANGLTKAAKLHVYAVASISDSRAAITVQKFKTSVHKDGDSDPTWNFPMKFTVNEAAGLQNRLTLVVKIKVERMLVDKNLGEVRVPIKELLQGVYTQKFSIEPGVENVYTQKFLYENYIYNTTE